MAAAPRVPSWFGTTELTWMQRCALRVLQAGHVPRHVAFIMDGNRRYARKAHMPTILHGHSRGFESLSHTLKWCRDFGIEEVTVYAFSIENFKRSKDEVDGLMALARDKFQELLNEEEQLRREGVRFRFVGDWSLLDNDLQQLMARVELMTMEHNKAFVNVCMAYTSQDEMCRAAQTVQKAVKENVICTDDICDQLYSTAFDMSAPDLLVRTSGEMRLSDFLLWQSAYTCIYFANVLWPEFGFWHLCSSILHYQTEFDAIEKQRQCDSDNSLKSVPSSETIVQFRQFVDQIRLDMLHSVVG